MFTFNIFFVFCMLEQYLAVLISILQTFVFLVNNILQIFDDVSGVYGSFTYNKA